MRGYLESEVRAPDIPNFAKLKQRIPEEIAKLPGCIIVPRDTKYATKLVCTEGGDHLEDEVFKKCLSFAVHFSDNTVIILYIQHLY